MNLKQILGIIVTAATIVGGITVAVAVNDAAQVQSSDASPEAKANATDHALTVAVENELPWWLDPFVWLADKWPLAAVGLLIVLRKTGHL